MRRAVQVLAPDEITLLSDQRGAAADLVAAYRAPAGLVLSEVTTTAYGTAEAQQFDVDVTAQTLLPGGFRVEEIGEHFRIAVLDTGHRVVTAILAVYPSTSEPEDTPAHIDEMVALLQTIRLAEG